MMIGIGTPSIQSKIPRPIVTSCSETIERGPNVREPKWFRNVDRTLAEFALFCKGGTLIEYLPYWRRSGADECAVTAVRQVDQKS
jgi:hypothetical protein